MHVCMNLSAVITTRFYCYTLDPFIFNILIDIFELTNCVDDNTLGSIANSIKMILNALKTTH